MLESFFKDAVSARAYALPHMETMGQRIKRLREARGWDQAHLAGLIGVTVSAVSQYELDQTQNPKLVPFLAMAEAFDTDVYYLVFGAAGPADPKVKRALNHVQRKRPKP